MIKNKKKVLITSLIILEILSLFLVYKSFPANETILEDVKLRENISNSSSFALMIQQEDGTYKESTSSKWPTEMEYNEELSGCMDVKGNKIDNSLSYNDDTNSIKLKVSGTTYCYIYFDRSSGESVIVKIATDGVKNVLPNYNKFKQELTCKSADAYFNTKYQRIEINQVSKKSTTCNLSYSKDTTNYMLLKDKVESVTEALNIDSSFFTEFVLNKDYNISNMETTSDSKEAFLWSETNKTWTSQNHTANTTDNGGVGMEFSLPDGTYQICYTMSSEKNYDYGTVFVDGVEKITTKGKSAVEVCESLGNLTTSNIIRIAYRKDGSGDSGDDNIVFKLKRVKESYDYHYTGSEPDNWIWYNNEKWRIIGSIPTIISDMSLENRVKIVRVESLGTLAYDKPIDSSAKWGSNTLYTLLNEYYYGKKDGTNTDYCVGYSQNGESLCNYSVSGISNDKNDYYGRMIADVHWKIGNVSTTEGNILNTYKEEFASVTENSIKIGLINPSDAYSWLIYQSPLLTTSVSNAISATNYRVGYYSADYYAQIYPSLYLNPEVYIINGDGSEENPYTLGM